MVPQSISAVFGKAFIIGPKLMPLTLICVITAMLAATGYAAPRPHTVTLGRWRTVELRSESGAAQETKIRELIIDGRIREYTTGAPHDVTERLFVVRHAYRMNDALPEEA